MSTEVLESLGWDERWAESFRPFAERGLVPGRVVLELRGVHSVMTAEGEVEASATGRLRHEARGPADLPAIGDWVALEPPSATGGRGRIHAVLPRRTSFVRKVAGARTQEQVVAANVDVLFVVMGLDGDFNLRRLERFLAAAWDSGAAPVIVLNKTDLAPDLERQRGEVEEVSRGEVPVIALAARAGEGLEALAPWLEPGRTIALVGSSGVGKSTLINALVGDEVMRTADVRSSDDRGRHTTSHRELVRLPGGALLIDNPGIRELQLWGDEGTIESTFEDIEELAEDCRFRDCRHESEPGCAVLAAVEEGELDEKRLESFRTLQREIDYLDRRQSQSAQLEEKRRWRNIQRAQRQLYKHRDRD